MSIVPGKGVKVGSAYVDVTPKLNQFQNQKVLAEVNKELQKAYTPNYAQLNDAQKRNQEIQARSAQQNTAAILRDKLTQMKEADKIQADAEKTASLNRQKLAKAETAAYQEEYRRRSNTQKQVDRDYRSAIAETRRRESAAAKDRDRENTNSEGILHRLATQFRTIGTLSRGLSFGVAGLGAFSLIRDVLGGIIAAGPIAAAGLALIPPAIAAIGVEAIVLQGAFKGVSKAIGDAFNPAKSKQFAADLKALSPAARSFVKEIREAKGILPNIQQTFFSAPLMQKAAENVKGFFQTIKGSFRSLISANGQLAGGVLTAITGPDGGKKVNQFLGSLSILLTEITPSVGKLTSSFLGFIGRVANQIAGPGGHGISHFFDSTASFLDRVNVPGLFDKASKAWHAFGGVLKDVGGTISGIVKAFGGTDSLGAGFFKNIGGLFKELNKFSNSRTGQSFLKELVGTLNTLSGLANGVLKTSLEFLASAFAALYPAIKPFSDAAGKLFKTIFTPAFGTLIGKIASDFLNFGTVILNTVTPAVKGLVNFLVAHPKVLEGIAVGVTAIWLALKIGKGVKSVASGINDLSTALDFFKNPKKILTGMGGVAAGETAIGNAGATAGGKSKVGALTSSLTGKVGLYGALVLVGAGLADVAAGFSDPSGPKAFNHHVSQIKSDISGLITGKNSFGKLRDDIVRLGFEMAQPGWLRTVAANLGAYTKNVAHAVRTGYNAVKDFITKTVPGWFADQAKSIDHVFAGVRHRVAQLVSDDIKGKLNSVKEFVTKTVPGWFGVMAHNIAAHFDEIRGNVHSWWSSVANFFTGTIKGFLTKTVPGWFSSMGRSISSEFGKIKSSVSTFVSSSIKGVFNSVSGFLTKTVPGWFGSMRSTVVSNVRGLVTDVQDVWSTITKVFSNPVDTVINKVMSGLAGAWNTVDGALGGKHHMNKPVYKGPFVAPKVPIPAHAGGGMVDPRFGKPTQDNVYVPPDVNVVHPGIRVSGGEYILKAASVASIPRPYLDALNQWGGRAVSGDPSGIHIFDPSSQRYAAGGSVPAEARARVGGVLSWLQSIAGRVPYVLGGNGPNSFDCSSLVGNVWARLTGNPINRRYFVTGNEAGWLSGHGFAPGGDPSGFTVGLTSPPEHTVGILGGHRFEAAHTGTRMRFDDGAANALRFARVFHMIGMSGVGGSFGLPAALQAVSTAAKFASHFNGIINKIKLPQTGYTPEAALGPPIQVKNMAAIAVPLILKAVAAAQAASSAGFGAGTALGNVGSGMVAKWIAQASKFANIPAGWVPGLEYIISRESGGNPNAFNHTKVGSQNAQGIMQELPSTFRANHAAGTSNNIMDPVANIASAVNYIHRRYGSPQNTPWLKHTGNFYAQGGPVLTRDRGGIIPTGLSQVFNGTGRDEYAFTSEQLEMLRHDCFTTIYLDGVDVTSKAHVVKNNNALALSLNRK